METLASGSDTRKIKIRLEKLLWQIRRAETKQQKTKNRAEKIQREIEAGTVLLVNLACAIKTTVAELDAAGWNRAAFEKRTGLKLPS